ncbi:hypothetical protein MSG28_004261 [Choristoneura fumiferana]|uniref:Uncharacterized protein n=1 Tax=Choristoneura fumiferana TaxID=7141 RepID=A0ACC0KIV6_CHOFU|nr:hypothetical protein MSG28_004261 [Choristoneura fumiferana]
MAMGIELRGLVEALTKHTPMCKPRSDRHPVWFSLPLIKCLREKAKYHKRFKKYGNPMDRLSFERLRNRCDSMLKECLRTFKANASSTLRTNPKYIWSYINGLKSNSYSIPNRMTSGSKTAVGGQEICDLFSEHFEAVYKSRPTTTRGPATGTCTDSSSHGGQWSLSKCELTEEEVFKSLSQLDLSKGAGTDDIPPLVLVKCAKYLAKPLTTLYQESLKQGVFPARWQTARVTPIHKKDDVTIVSHYRPVSILPAPGKVFESIIQKKIYWHVKQQLHASQHGFLPRRSTTTWQRRGSPLPLLFFRLVLAAASVGFLVWSLTSGQSGLSPLWLIYLTNWGLVMVTAMAVSGFFVSAMIAYKRPDTMVYATTAAFWLDVAVHGFNSVISVGELVISRTPVRWLHVYQPLLVAAVYVAFSGIYYATDGTNGVGELVISRTSVRWLHVYQPLLVAAVYVAFSGIYYATDGSNGIELVVSRTPVRWLHVYQPLLVAAVYVAFSGIYYATDGTNGVGELVISRTPVRWLHVYQPLLVAAVYVAFSGIYYATDGTNGVGELVISRTPVRWLHVYQPLLVAAVYVAFSGIYYATDGTNGIELVVSRTPVRWLHVYQPLLVAAVYVAFSGIYYATDGTNGTRFNSVISIELVVSRTPVRWLHVYQPLLVAAVYVAFSGIYYATDGTNGFGEPFIYPVLNWNEPGMAGAVSGGSLLGVFVVHTLVWALALGRNKLSDIFFQRQTHELPHTHDKA